MHLKFETELTAEVLKDKTCFDYIALPDQKYLLKLVFVETKGSIHNIINREFDVIYVMIGQIPDHFFQYPKNKLKLKKTKSIDF